ncbi:3'(2'),5'-bisphosphate nucleotidase CysQ [Reichenbachiella sp. MALMAid0571]|uniref:3'(2'),5'-bisphosphate nucleotidase CysQ n=1 Tax=Reichenbachiella sp. MALMAid0571 TaxID=3143939 RepID=UPI0032DF9BCB
MSKRKIIPCNPKLKELAKQLRKNMTLSEVLLWDQLKQKKMMGFDFDRQRPINNFIVDFYCKDLMLALEIDGDSHNHEESYNADLKRQHILEESGISFLRFDDLEVKKSMNNVLRTIQYWIEDNMEKEDNIQRPTPTPPGRGIASQDKISSEGYSRDSNVKSSSGSLKTNLPTKSKETTKENPLPGGAGDYQHLIEIAKEASIEAGKAILEVYNSNDFNVEKKGDDSPLTKADKRAHNVIVSFLEKTGLPILSEEGRDIPYEERKNWEYFWMVDPLDGTKEFIKRNGEFTVNIALIEKDRPVAGVIYVPVTEKLYWAAQGLGSHLECSGTTTQIFSNKIALNQKRLKVVASRSHLNEDTQQFLDSLIEPQTISMGSSLKFTIVAEGKADVYPRFAPTMEWDTAAAQIIVEESGAKVLRQNEDISLLYNKENLLNPHFIVINN